MTISLVQGPATNTSSAGATTVAVNLSSAPANGNYIIAAVGADTYATTGVYVTGISQSNVTWTKCVQNNDPNGYLDAEIWLGTVGNSAGTSLTVTLSANSSNGKIWASVCEWTGLATSPLDKVASNGSGNGPAQTSTGTTAQTTQATELCIGAIINNDNTNAQTSPTNGYTMLSGVNPPLVYSYKTVTTQGTQNTGTTCQYSSSEWDGVISTFKASSGGTASKLAYTAGTNQSLTTGSVSSVVTVQVQDSNSNPVTTGATVSLSTSSSGGTFYSDSGGNTQITTVTISSGQSSGNFYYKDTTAGTPTLTSSATGLTSATTQFTINQSGSGQWTAGAVSNVANGIKISGSTLTLDNSYSPTFTGLTANGIINSNASGSYPSPGSNAGLILQIRYTPSHRDGLGIQSGGIWLKYDNNFNIYCDNGSTLLTAIALDTNGDMTVNGIINSQASGSAPVAGSNAGMILDCYTPSHRDGLGIQSGGIWLKYDNQFDIYYDSGTALTNSLHLDSSGNTKLISLNVQNINVQNAAGTYGHIGLGDVNPTFVKASGNPLGINHESPAIISKLCLVSASFRCNPGQQWRINWLLDGFAIKRCQCTTVSSKRLCNHTK